MTEAIATGGAMAPLLAAVKARQETRDRLLMTIAATEAMQVTVDVKAVEKHVLAKLADWRQLLTSNVEDGRELLRQVLIGPLRFTAQENRRYRFDGEAAIRRLLSGVVGVSTLVASPPGSVDGWHFPISGFSDLKAA